MWGADPAAGEGPPARLQQVDGRLVLRGVKTFCSGAGGVQRALVIAADQDGSRRLAYLDTTSRVNIDRGWYRASGLRSSESHRVEFHDTPVLALLGAPGELSREPYFSRDAIRTSATWAGLADRILAETLAALDPARLDAMQAHGLGRMRIAQSTIDRWLDHTTTALDQPDSTRPAARPDGARRRMSRRTVRMRAADLRPGGPGLRIAGADRSERPGPRPTRPRPVPAPASSRPQDHQARCRDARHGATMTATATAERFERLYHESPDPWGYRTSDYEREKYAATLAALPKRSHGLCLEVGCSIGVLHRPAGGSLRARRRDRLLPRRAAARPPTPARSAERRSAPRQLPRGSPTRLLGSDRLLGDPLLPAAEPALRRGQSAGSRRSSPTARACSRSAGAAIGREEPLLGDEVHDRLARRARRLARARRAPRRIQARPLRRSMSPRRIVIVGAGPAGLATARAYREHGGGRRGDAARQGDPHPIPSAAAHQGVPARRARRQRAADRVARLVRRARHTAAPRLRGHRDRPEHRHASTWTAACSAPTRSCSLPAPSPRVPTFPASTTRGC